MPSAARRAAGCRRSRAAPRRTAAARTPPAPHRRRFPAPAALRPASARRPNRCRGRSLGAWPAASCACSSMRRQRLGVDHVLAGQQRQRDRAKFLSSRTLPRHGWRVSSSTASAVSCRRGRPSPAASARKWRASGVDVVGPFAQRRQRDRHDVEAVVEVLAELAGRRSAAPGRGWWRRRSRASTAISSRPPTRRIVPDCSARSSRVCACIGMSPISSRNSVPPAACSNLPICRATAPVKAPFSCPNSSLSISSAGIAAALTATNGPVGAVAELVDRLGDQLLAGARFAEDQHGQVVAQHPRDHPVTACIAGLRPTSGSASPDRRLVVIRRSTPALAPTAWRTVRDQLVDVERLGEIFERAGVAGAHRGIERVLRRKDDDRQRRDELAHRAERLDPVAVGQHDVGHQRGKASPRAAAGRARRCCRNAVDRRSPRPPARR